MSLADAFPVKRRAWVGFSAGGYVTVPTNSAIGDQREVFFDFFDEPA